MAPCTSPPVRHLPQICFEEELRLLAVVGLTTAAVWLLSSQGTSEAPPAGPRAARGPKKSPHRTPSLGEVWQLPLGGHQPPTGCCHLIQVKRAPREGQ